MMARPQKGHETENVRSPRFLGLWVRPPERGTKPKTEVHTHSVPPMVVRIGAIDQAVLAALVVGS